MICNVTQSLTHRTIHGSDLLFLRKESLIPPIQQSALLLPALKKLANQRLVLVSRPLHVPNSVENLSFKCEMEAEAAAKKNIIGVYLATWWALQNMVALNLKQQLNALALTPYPKILLACACGWSLPLIMLISWPMLLESSKKPRRHNIFKRIINIFYSITGLCGTTTLVNESDNDIEFFIHHDPDTYLPKMTLRAHDEAEINADDFNCLSNIVSPRVVVKMNEEKLSFDPQGFITHKKFIFKMDNDGKLVVDKVKRS